MIRILALAGGLTGAAGLSQFPEFSQQYLQRLAGQADALAEIVAAFDQSAETAGLTREAALAELSGTTFRDAHQEDMRGSILRAAQVESDLALLRAATPLERLALPHRFRDTQTLQATWADFRPAIPVTSEGLITTGIGFGVGWIAIGAALRSLAMLFGRGRRRRAYR